MSYANSQSLVTTEWLQEHLSAPDVKVVDASFFLPILDRDAKAEHNELRLPGAVFFDIDDIADDSTDLPHMMPSPEKFASRVKKLGLGDGNHIVVYDSTGVAHAACRVWWMFRYFGYTHVSVLDGGLPKWLREKRPVEEGPPTRPMERHFTPRIDAGLYRSIEQVIANLESQQEQVIDARAANRFTGEAAEPRPSKHQGHIPGSLNLPFTDLIDPREMTFRPADEIADVFSRAGVDFKKQPVASCGSGVTACVIAFAAHLIGKPEVAVYDGSWSEWGNRDDVPISRGEA